MNRFITLLLALSAAGCLCAQTFIYSFSDTPLSKALARISEEHPEANINFIYNEIENYRTSARIATDDPVKAVREAIGFNPVAVTSLNGLIFAEALQHGRYDYHGHVRDSSGEPLEGATVMILAGRDSVMVSYAVTDSRGAFHIPCDRKNITAKVSCIGFHTRYLDPESFDMGNITLIDLPIRLKEVTVKADDAYILSDRTVYMPSSRQKNSAQSAVDLLRAMAIPQIIIKPDGGISDHTGDAVKIYINSLPASPEEQQGLRTADVRRVEYLQYPTDARFGGAHKVINFIVQQYEYGGYTKATADESVLTGLASNVSLFSKFAYRRMVYDLYVGSDNSDNHHTGQNISADYTLTDSRGERYVVTRDERVESSHIRSNSLPVTLRATYATDKVQFVNTAGFTHSDRPDNLSSGSLRYSDDPGKGYVYTRSNPLRANTLSYSGFLYASLPRGFSLSVVPDFRYTHRNDRLFYSTTASGDLVDRSAVEDAYWISAFASLSKSFGRHHSLQVNAGTYNDISDLSYAGSDNFTGSYHHLFNHFSTSYTFNQKGLNLVLLASLSHTYDKSNGVTTNDVTPLGRIALDYRFDNKNSMSAMVNLAQRSYGIDARSTEVLRVNDLMYATGNPDMKSCPELNFSLSYTWLPSNLLYLNVYAYNDTRLRNRKEVYLPYDDGRAIIRTTLNDGRYYRTAVSASATLRLLDGKLQLNAGPKQLFYRTGGIDGRSYSAFSCNVGLNLFLDRWYFNASYYSPDNKLTEVGNTILRSRSLYWATAGWSNGTWNFRLSAYNIFNRGWALYTETYRSEYYSCSSVGQNTYFHPRINLSVTYTIGYGKKVGRGNEVGGQGSAASAIVK